MGVQSVSFLTQPAMPATKTRFPAVTPYSWHRIPQWSWREVHFCTRSSCGSTSSSRTSAVRVLALDHRNSGSDNGNGNEANKKASVPNSNYVVPLDTSSCITRPLAEILRDLNKRIPDNIIQTGDGDGDGDGDGASTTTFIPWYHANRMLSFYAPELQNSRPVFRPIFGNATTVCWCGEIRDVIFSDNGSVIVIYRVTIRGSDGEAHRESTGTVSSGNGHVLDPVAAAEEIAFCKACARFGLGLYLYHDE